jgi:hypothetical protein
MRRVRRTFCVALALSCAMASVAAKSERRFEAEGVLSAIVRSESAAGEGTVHAPATPVAIIGGEVYLLRGAVPSGRGRMRFEGRLEGNVLQLDKALPLATEPRAKASAAVLARSAGSKRIAWLRVRFSDQTDAVMPSVATVQATADGVGDFMRDFSYGAFAGLDATIPPVLALADSESSYRNAPGGDVRLLNDARAAALVAGIDVAQFDFYVVRYHGGPGASAGQALVGAPGMWLRTDAPGIAAHELGHNLGLLHANAWEPAGADPAGAGQHQEYGNPFDRLGGGSNRSEHFCASSKQALGWLGAQHVARIWGSGTYRIVPQDRMALDTSAAHAARFGRARLWMPFAGAWQPQAAHYWFERRELRAEFRQALHVNLAGDDNWLIDMTPASPGGASDAGLVLGRTYSDAQLGLHLTLLAVDAASGATQLRVERGRFDANRAPLVSLGADAAAVAIGQSVGLIATGSDPDGDALAYSWEFGDGNVGAGPGASASRAWYEPGSYRVRVVASDMKGASASASVTVRVGSPNGLRIAGRVLAQGIPLEGVHVWNGGTGAAYRGTYTDSDGSYAVENLLPGSLRLQVGKTGWRISPRNGTSEFTLGDSLEDIVFDATPQARVEAEVLDREADPRQASNTARLRLTRSGDLGAALTVHYRLEGSASFGGDYSLIGGGASNASFAAGAATLDLVIMPVADSIADEPDERVVLRLADGVDYEVVYPAAAEAVIRGRTAPPNDDFAQRTRLSGARIDLVASNRDATLEFEEPPAGPAEAGSATVWWAWTAPASGTAAIDLHGSGFDTVLDLYRGDVLEDLVLHASNDDAEGALSSRIVFEAFAGKRYAIAVSSAIAGVQGDIRLRLDLATDSGESPFTLLRDGFD